MNNVEWDLPVQFNVYDIDLKDEELEQVWVDCYDVNVVGSIVNFHINSEIFIDSITHYSLNLQEHSEYFRNKQ